MEGELGEEISESSHRWFERWAEEQGDRAFYGHRHLSRVVPQLLLPSDDSALHSLPLPRPLGPLGSLKSRTLRDCPCLYYDMLVEVAKVLE